MKVAAQTQDDGFHDIQLNGKQLVFLFMSATVVSAVIFLCGVMVGRGVRAQHPYQNREDHFSNTASGAVFQPSTPKNPLNSDHFTPSLPFMPASK